MAEVPPPDLNYDFITSGRPNHTLYQDDDPKHTPRKASKWSQQNKVNI